MKESIVFDKAKRFALRVVKLSRFLNESRGEHTMARQLLKSGTSIGANLAEAQYAMSKADFLAKLYISLKECAETAYWLDLLHDAGYLDDEQHQSVSADCADILHMLQSSTRTIRSKEKL